MPKPKFWNFKAKTEDTGELTLYGDISSSTWYGDEVTPKDFKSDLDSLGDIKNLNIYINSGGGDVFAGQTIYSILKRHSASKTVYVDGLAASIASVIAMAGDKIIMPKNAMMMIHNAWTIAAGNSEYFKKLAGDMEKIDESIQNVYVDKTGLDRDEISKLMSEETWMTADDALGRGFADEVEEEKLLAASMNGGFLILNGQQFDLSRFNKQPEVETVEAEKDPKVDPETPEVDPDADPETPDEKEEELQNDSGGESRPVSDNQKELFNTIRKKIIDAY